MTARQEEKCRHRTGVKGGAGRRVGSKMKEKGGWKVQEKGGGGVKGKGAKRRDGEVREGR